MLYQGFISYSHAADDKLAPALQRGLHALAKPWYRRRALRVFRDKTSLSANPALWPAIEQALRQSDWFLFMASPLAAKSAWVQKELQWWLEHRTSDKMLMLLTDGELSWDGRARDFDWNRTTAVPNVLRGRFPDEPLYVDLRWARKEDSLSIRHSQFRGAILDIAAPLHGKAKDELDGEDVRQHRRNKAWAWSAASALSVLAVVASGAAFYAFEQRNEAIAQRNLAQGRQLRTDAQRLAPIDSQWTTAALLAAESARRMEDADTYETLWKLVANRARPVARFSAKQGGGLVPLTFSPDGQRAATADSDAVLVFTVHGGGQEAQSIPFPGLPRFIAFNAAADQIVVSGDDSVRVFAVASGKEIARRDSGQSESAFGFSPDGQLVAVASGTRVTVMESFTGRPLAAADIPIPVTKVVVGPGGRVVALISGKTVRLLDTTTGRPVALLERRGDVSSVAFSADGTLAAVASWDGEEGVTIVDVASGETRDQVGSGSSGVWFSKQGHLLVTEGYSTLAVRDLDEKGSPTVLTLLGSARSLDWSDDGEFLVVGTDDDDGSTSVFRVGNWRPLARWKHQGTVDVDAVAISPDGDLVASRANRTTTIFRTHQDVPLVHMSVPGKLDRTAFSADGKTIAGLFDDRDLYLFRVGADRSPVPAGQCQNAKILTLTANGSRMAAGCYDGTARIVDGSGALVGEVPHRYGTRLAISADGTMVFSVGPQGATIFKVADRSVVRVIGGDSITAVAFSPSGSHLVIASGGAGAKVFETSGDRPPVSFDEKILIESVTFSPDGKRVALGARSRYANV